MLHTSAMTMPDTGQERPGGASETRQMVERQRTETGARVSGRVFWAALTAIVLGIFALALLLR